MRIGVPSFIMRKIVRRNPWLLSDSGLVHKFLKIGIFEIEAEMKLRPDAKTKFQEEEADAGTLLAGGKVYERIYGEVSDEFHNRIKSAKGYDAYFAVLKEVDVEIARRVAVRVFRCAKRSGCRDSAAGGSTEVSEEISQPNSSAATSV